MADKVREFKTPEDIEAYLGGDVDTAVKAIGELNKLWNEQQTALDEIKDPDGAKGVKAIAKGMQAINKRMDELSRQRVPVMSENGKRRITRMDVAVHGGIKALHMAPTPVERNVSGGGFKVCDDPTAEFQENADVLYFMRTSQKMDREEVKASAFYNEIYKPSLQRTYEIHKEAFDTADAGAGLEWIPTQFSPRVEEKIRLSLRVLANIPVVNMPRSTFTLPVHINDLAVFTFTEQTASPTTISLAPSNGLVDALGTINFTAKVTFTGRGIGSVATFSNFVEEDAISSIRDAVNNNLPIAIANGLENCAQNGDRTATHQDNDIAAVTAHVAKAFPGFRYYAINTATGAKKDASGQKINTSANWRDYVMVSKGLMGKYGTSGQPLILIVSPGGFNSLLSVEDFATAASLAGGSGTNTLGDFRFRPYGIEVVTSEFCKDNLAATGVNTSGGPNTFSSMTIVNTNAWRLGAQRNTTITPIKEMLVAYDQQAVAVTWRGDMQPLYAQSTDAHVGYVYDVAL